MYANKGKVMLGVSFDHQCTAQAGFLPAAGTMKAHYWEVLRRLTLEIRLNRKKAETSKMSSKRLDFTTSHEMLQSVLIS